jgi:hypothetical protein
MKHRFALNTSVSGNTVITETMTAVEAQNSGLLFLKAQAPSYIESTPPNHDSGPILPALPFLGIEENKAQKVYA